MTNTTIDLPSGKYFISHAYKDAEIRDRMLARLPNDVEPFIFPPITVKPDEFVSNPMIEAILACDGLIFLRGGYSERSFWVAFERDYALRNGKTVVAYDPTANTFSAFDELLRLEITPVIMRPDRRRVKKALNFLSEERSFDILPLKLITHFGDGLPTDSPGYLMLFWSENTYQDYVRIPESPPSGYYLPPEPAKAIQNVLYVLLDDVPLPSWYEYVLLQYPGMDAIKPVQLFDDVYGLNEMANRIDDLIVRLYWLIFRNQYPDSIDI